MLQKIPTIFLYGGSSGGFHLSYGLIDHIMKVALAKYWLQDVASPFIANGGIVKEGKFGKVNCSQEVNSSVICAIGMDET